MLNEQTLEKLYAMKLSGLAEAWQEQQLHPQSSDLSFDERLGLLVERQWLWKENRALVTRLKFAQLRQSACLEDIDYHHPRALKRAVVEQLATCDWIRHHRHCIITGPTGVGKSYLGCAFAHKACREGFRALYFYGSKLFRTLQMAQADGSLTRLLKRLASVDLLVIDDWGLTPLKPDQYRLFLEILDDRQGIGANLITSQYKVKEWHQLIGDPTVGDAILDRLVHSAHKLELEGDSMRGKKRT
jgi:DNA replication protein DnaC